MPTPLSDLIKKINKKQIKLAVVGLGYVGFPLALEFINKRIKVTGIEINQGRLKNIAKNKSYISDISDQELKAANSGGYFTVSSDFSDLKQCDCILICVPTPLKKKTCRISPLSKAR